MSIFLTSSLWHFLHSSMSRRFRNRPILIVMVIGKLISEPHLSQKFLFMSLLCGLSGLPEGAAVAFCRRRMPSHSDTRQPRSLVYLLSLNLLIIFSLNASYYSLDSCALPVLSDRCLCLRYCSSLIRFARQRHDHKNMSRAATGGGGSSTWTELGSNSVTSMPYRSASQPTRCSYFTPTNNWCG